MFYELNSEGHFVCDAIRVDGLSNWTKDQPPQPCNKPIYKGKRKASGEWKGVWTDTDELFVSEDNSMTERLWRDSELNRADVQLNKVQDGVQNLGSVAAWRKYRMDLRDWPENVNFPDSTKRPSSPDEE